MYHHQDLCSEGEELKESKMETLRRFFGCVVPGEKSGEVETLYKIELRAWWTELARSMCALALLLFPCLQLVKTNTFFIRPPKVEISAFTVFIGRVSRACFI